MIKQFLYLVTTVPGAEHRKHAQKSEISTHMEYSQNVFFYLLGLGELKKKTKTTKQNSFRETKCFAKYYSNPLFLWGI